MQRKLTWRSETVRQFARTEDPVALVRHRATELVLSVPGPPFRLNSQDVLRAAQISTVRFSRAVPGDGRIFLGTDGYIVEINSGRPPERKSFTLAHEIAHTFFLPLDTKRRAARTDVRTERFSRDDEEEFLCDVAAAEMLMPREAFLSHACRYGPSTKSILGLARVFDTSLTSTARRFAEIDAWRCHVGVWKAAGGTTPRFQFGFASEGVELSVPKGAMASERSVVTEAARQRGLRRGWSDIGLVSRRAEAFGEVFAEAMKLNANDLVLSVAIFDRYPEHLVSMFDSEERRRETVEQAAFRFPPPHPSMNKT